MESQHGATALPQRTSRGAEKTKESGNSKVKGTKTPGKEGTRDMLYYAQKLQLPCAQPSGSEEVMADLIKKEEEGQPWGAAAIFTDQEEQSQNKVDENPSEQAQPTLWEILKAVNKCTASIDKLKTHPGSLSEDVALIRQDLKKI